MDWEMRVSVQNTEQRMTWCGVVSCGVVVVCVLTGCRAAGRQAAVGADELSTAVAAYQMAAVERVDKGGNCFSVVEPARYWPGGPRRTPVGNILLAQGMVTDEPLTTRATTQPAQGDDAAFVPPEGYWRRNIWHQMGYEAKHFGARGFWGGFKTAFWDLENALILSATLGASITIREAGVDDTIRERTLGHRQLGDLDEPIQLLGHPGTHFAATGALWLTSALTKDVEQHEVAKSLTKALAVNGATTMALKAIADTEAPNGDDWAWPSGHTSSAFTAAAVLNEYYGPWVGIPSIALAGLVGYQRIDSRVHDFSDVVFGAMLGYMVGTSIAKDEKARFPELFGMEVVPFVDPPTGATGFALIKRW
jgi:membrane-associated phospholipid phosphatase